MGKTRFTRLPTAVYRYTQKPILYHDIELKCRCTIRITHHYKIVADQLVKHAHMFQSNCYCGCYKELCKTY